MLHFHSSKIFTIFLFCIHILFLAEICNAIENTPGHKFSCTSIGKFLDLQNPHRYHQCFLLFGKLTYIHNTCPAQTCFSKQLDYCVAEACMSSVKPTTTYNCESKSYKCKTKGIFPHPQDSSVYYKCSKVWGKWTAICFQCNNKHKTCYSEKLEACIPNNGKPCENKEIEEPSTDSNVTTVTYDCEGYSYFPCTQLGIGFHQFPGDKSVYMQCTKNKQGKMEGKCFTCPKKGNTCFVEGIDQCVERCGKGSPHKPYNCSTYTVNDVACAVEGYMASPKDTSVFFKCVKNGTLWDIQCYTCSNGKVKTCFSEIQQACVTYDGPPVNSPLDKENADKCPSISVIDGLSTTSNVGTPDNSLTWDCEGYSNEEAFPCNKIAIEGEHKTAADRSIYFTCSKQGDKWAAECQSCPSETWSCYDPKEKTCVNDCVPRVHLPYDCRTYDEHSFHCTETGYFSNPNDTSIYHSCNIQDDNTFISWCYTCSNGPRKTCFSNEMQACVTNGNDVRPCGTIESLIENPDKGTKESSLTYSTDGYSETSFPCKDTGLGEFDKPGDSSVYVICKEGNVPEFHVCPEDTKSCYDKEEKRCIENCGMGLVTTTIRPVPSYSCAGDISFECTEEGIYSYPSDTSLYINCVKNEVSDTFIALCYTCNSVDQTCYSENVGACIKPKEGACGPKENLESETEAKPHFSYKCQGYSIENSFPCENLGSRSFYPVPGDKSVYFECYTASDGQLVAKCHTCLKSVNSCFDEEKKVCVKNCGKGELHKPYDCSTYTDGSYPCTKSGYFANSFHSSVYFQCINVNGTWKSYCYSCNSLLKTCFNDEKQACVLNNGKECGNTTMPVKGGTKLESLSFSCKGYNSTSFPCRKLEPGTYLKPGDWSIFWTCGETEEEDECHACGAKRKECYDPVEETCIENCGKGPPPIPYNCSTYNRKSFSCRQEGYFGNPRDLSIYFRCLKNNESETGWDLDCFSCNSRNRTCFDDKIKACVENGGHPCGETLVTGPPSVVKNASLIHSCLGYEGYQFNCRKSGNFTNFGDKSIYYTCTEHEDRILSHCKACPKAYKGCFIEEKNLCIDNCGIGSIVNGSIRPYDCSGYHLESFPCKKEGLFRHPQDFTVFFHCLKNTRTHKWESRCYSCNLLSKSCFSNNKQRCIIGCVDEINPSHNHTDNSLTYGNNCRGYGLFAVPCAALLSGKIQTGVKTYFQHLGDPAVYFSCVQVALFFQAFCHMCPISSCFDQTNQNCMAPCSDYIPLNTTNPVHVGPPWSHDCRFYNHHDSYPCTEQGLFVNPVDTSIYFHCVQTKSGFNSICYTCHSKLKSCFNQAKKACFVTEDSDCGTIYTTNATGNGRSYDCSGYEPLPSLPCSPVGAGNHSLPGDSSVYFTCKPESNSSDAQLIGECHTCSQEKAGCYDFKKKICVDHCILTPYKPYSCAIYNYYSFHCTTEGFYAQLFDSSVFFQCVKEGKYFKALCYTCNSHLKTCFSNKKQTCLTKGGGPCGDVDPFDAVVGGTEMGSLHHSCLGYNELSFPCIYYRAGKFSTPADFSIYFNCVKLGDKWLAECGACSKKDESCFDGQRKVCVENCGRGPHVPYQCHSYPDYQAISCKQEGYFTGKDSSVFFKCVNSDDIWAWKTFCFSCNEVLGTCFDQLTRACLTNDGVPCKAITGPGHNNKKPIKGEVDESRSYDCTGYNELSLPCVLYGPGKWAHPADQSVYFECIVTGGQLLAECHHCDSNFRECFIDKEQKCVANCGLGPHKPWNCLTRRFKCVTEGLFSDPLDNSVFYSCQRKADGKLESQCFSCSSGPEKTCFSKKKNMCLKINGESCTKFDPSDLDNTVTEENSRTYSCLGYNEWSFPCSKYPPGLYFTFAEKSVYFECKTGTDIADCKICNGETDSIFDPVTRTCVANFGKGEHQPYNCYTYGDQFYKCKKAGYFASKTDTSVFFKCVNRGTHFESHCYSCSSTNKTCFSNSQQSCITNNGKKCEGGDPFTDADGKSGTKETSLTFDCDGYNKLSFPCAKHSPGLYGHPGDLSVYFSCEKEDNFYVAQCHTCNKTEWGCFDNTKGLKKCVPNCLRGEFQPYHCNTTHWMSYPCSKEGELGGHPESTSVFFKCVRNRNVLEASCHSCNEKFQTCWSNELAACVTVANEEGGEPGSCGPEDPVDYEGHGDEKSSRTYDTVGYKLYPPHFPCKKYGEGQWSHYGDKSVYVICTKKKDMNGEIIWKEEFRVCQDKKQGGFYNTETQKCDMENRVLPTRKPPRPRRPYKPKKAKKLKVAKLPGRRK